MELNDLVSKIVALVMTFTIKPNKCINNHLNNIFLIILYSNVAILLFCLSMEINLSLLFTKLPDLFAIRLGHTDGISDCSECVNVIRHDC